MSAQAVQHDGYGYAIWIVPRGAAGAQLASVVSRLAPWLPKHHTPHATLRCHLASVPQARAVALAVAAVTAPFTLRVSAVVEACHVHYAPEEADDHCRAVHAVVSGDGFLPALSVASRALRESVFTPHTPHISLAYRYGAPYTAEEVANLHATAAGESAIDFRVESLTIASCHGLWHDWRVLEEIPLRGACAVSACRAALLRAARVVWLACHRLLLRLPRHWRSVKPSLACCTAPSVTPRTHDAGSIVEAPAEELVPAEA